MIFYKNLLYTFIFTCTSIAIKPLQIYNGLHFSEGSGSCISSIVQAHCPNNFVLVSDEGSCPKCKTGSKLCEHCEKDTECAPGLKCDIINARSIVSNNNKNANEVKQCIYDKSTCHYLNHLPDHQLKWIPDCEIKGTFKEKQCRGDNVLGRCFCFDNVGNKIFGWDWKATEHDMTCACSRHRTKLEALGRQDITQHCSQNGNFEDLQCDLQICWCADTKTGALAAGTIIVPKTLWKTLPCYKQTLHGETYLRLCESVEKANADISQTFAIHGTMNAAVKTVICDYDGSYGAYQVLDEFFICSWRNGAKISEFFKPLISNSLMDCACARDKILFDANNISFRLKCNNQGGYEHLQLQQSDYFCVDALGYAVTDFKQEIINCSHYLYEEISISGCM